MRKRRRSNNKKIIVILIVSLIFVLSVGYSAFSTNINISGKGNIVGIKAADMLKKQVVTAGE